MSALEILLVVALAGGTGGIVAALLSEDKGFVLPKKVSGDVSIVRPGFIGLILVGAAAAALSFALYGPLSSETVVGGPESADSATANEDNEDFGLTLAALGGAFLIGIGGSKWLSSQVDKSILQAAAAEAAAGGSDSAVAAKIGASSPLDALAAARTLK